MPSPNSFSITIADIELEVQSALSPAELKIEERLGPFFGQSDRPAGRVQLRWEESADAPVARGQLVYDPGSLWRMYRAGDETEAAIQYNHPRPTAVLRANALWDQVTLVEQRGGAEWVSRLNYAGGELLLRTRIIPTGGLVFHASGIDDNGRGIAFVGHAGAGKSTQVGLWTTEPGVIAMNDDRIAVRPGNGGARCYGTPWGGSANIARNHSAPLSAIILLEQAPENAVDRLATSAAIPALLARSFLPYWDRALMARAMENLQAILACVPVYRLRCRPEMAVIPLVRSVL